MEKIKRVFLVFGVMISVSCQAFSYDNSELSLEKAEKMWASKKFSAKAFKEGDSKLRAEMVVDLIRSKSYLEKPLKKVIEDLGSPDGYYKNDGIPAYLLVKTEKKSKQETIWQVVFIPDKEWKKVRAVEIRKN
jgi:hypothetical protein